MSLFPAYAGEDNLEDCEGGSSLSPGAECALLEEEPRAAPPAAAPAPPAPRDSWCYEDRRLDTGNLRVSTLYYPARPEYRARNKALGTKGERGNKARRRERVRRYWRGAAAAAAVAGGGTLAEHTAQCAARCAALRAALHAQPGDEQLWLHYIDFLEWCGRAGGESPEEAVKRGVRACGGRRGAALRDRLHALLAPADLGRQLRNLREHIPTEQLSSEAADALRGELWAREVSAQAAGADLRGAGRVAAAAAADRALRDHAHLPLLAYGAVLRSAGLMERLVKLIELVAAMNFPSGGAFPPAQCPRRYEAAEQQLSAWEAVTAGCGLPTGVVWARVERARVALHWRAPPLGADLGGDAERAPSAAALAPLLRAAGSARASFRLLVTLLRLTEAPLLPHSSAAARGAAGGAGGALLAASWERACGAGLLALLRAARRLCPAHPARRALSPPAARRLLADTPLRAFSPADTTGFVSWCGALWEAALQWSAGRRRRALLCWRLRVLHAHLLALTDEESIKRVRSSARELLRRYAEEAATPYAVFARLEAAAGGDGARVALRALRAALAALDEAAALHAARVVQELAPPAAARWALLCAAAARPLPPDHDLSAAPPAVLLLAARRRCHERCADLERRLEADGGEEEPDEALLPAAAEWAAARVRLAEPAERRRLLGDLLRLASQDCTSGGRLARYREQMACALVAAGGGGGGAGRAAARALAPLAPLNGYLALAREGGAGVAGCAGGAGGAGRAGAATGELWVLADSLPALLTAAARDWPPEEARVVERGLSRASAEAAGGALAAALRLAAAVAGGAGGAAAGAGAVLTLALHAAPHCQWLYVRGAALAVGGPELADLLLDRELRLHVLPLELPLLVDLAPAAQHKPACGDNN